MNLIKYEAFVRISELGNITKVAKELGYSQPGISHMLDSLEAEFGFPLLIRGKDSIQLTDNGHEILKYCKQVIENEEMLQDMVSKINGIIAGNISLGAISSTLASFMPKLINTFSTAHKSIKIRILEDSVSGLKNKLETSEIDAAIMTNDIPYGFTFRPLIYDNICLIVNKEHPLASYDQINFELLDTCNLIMPISGWDDNVTLVQQASPFEPNVNHYVASDTAAISMVRENMGVYIISKLQCADLPDSIVVKDFADPVTRSIGIVAKPSKMQSPAVKEFIQTAIQFINSYTP